MMAKLAGSEVDLISTQLQRADVGLEDVGNPKKPLEFRARAECRAELSPDRDQMAEGILMAVEVYQGRRPTKKDPSEAVLLAGVSLAYLALFSVEPALRDVPSDDDLAAFATGEGFAAMFPYLQQHVADLVGRLGFPPLVLASGDVEVAVMSESEPPSTE